jgi:hypothetical protein
MMISHLQPGQGLEAVFLFQPNDPQAEMLLISCRLICLLWTLVFSHAYVMKGSFQLRPRP